MEVKIFLNSHLPGGNGLVMSGVCDTRVAAAVLGVITDALVVANNPIVMKAEDENSIVVGACAVTDGVSQVVGIS